MGFSPVFQQILDKCQERDLGGTPLPEIQQFFFEECVKIGPYERLNNLYRIRPKKADHSSIGSRYQFFTVNKMQEEFFKNHTNRDLVLKMRQGGVTTLSCLIALDMALFGYGVHTAIMAHVRDNVKKFFRIVKNSFVQFQKDWGTLYPVSREIDNVSEMKINPTGSELVVCTETKGLTLDFLHISEACFVEDDRISESIESVPMSGWVIMESTPNIASGMFYDTWMENEQNNYTLFRNHFFPWWYQYPEEKDLQYIKFPEKMNFTEEENMLMEAHDLNKSHVMWRRLKISESGGDKAEFLRKYPEDPMTCFLSGAQSVFPANIMGSMWKASKDPRFTGDLQIS